MVVKRQRQALAPVIWPSPPTTERGHPDGFRRDTHGELVLTESGAAQAAIAQRIVLRYAIMMESHDEMTARYGYSLRQIKQIATGRAWSHLTRPVRLRLTAMGLGNHRARRTPAGRAHFKAVMQGVAARAVEYMRWPHLYYPDEIEEVANDLYLLSGAWQEQEL